MAVSYALDAFVIERCDVGGLTRHELLVRRISWVMDLAKALVNVINEVDTVIR